MQWSQGQNDGGTAVIDYQVSYGVSSGSFTTLIPSIAATAHTVTGLAVGVTYKFKVRARNSVGLSAYSAEVEILIV